MARFLFLFVTVQLAAATLPSLSQPLVNPYPFSMPGELQLDPSLVYGTTEPAGARGRISVQDGHFVDPDGERFRIVGTTLRLGACFPDSAAAIRIADRLQALGINTVQFFQFDYTAFQPVSILADGTSSLGAGLYEENVDRLDWFTFQLKEHGIYYAFVFHSVWIPRAEDGVRQPDSTGLGARTPVFFDPAIQRIHHGIMEMLLAHQNPYTGQAYKDDPALLYVMPFEDPSLSLYWVYTRDVVRSTDAGDPTVGLEYHALMDSLYQEHLLSLGYNSDAVLEQAWSPAPSNTTQQVRNGGFEDPFDQASWQFFANTGAGAQAVLQYTQNDVAQGKYAAHVLIGNPSENFGAIFLTQALTETQNKHKYQLRLKARTNAPSGSRTIDVFVYNGVTPFEAMLARRVQIGTNWTDIDLEFVAKTSNDDTPVLRIGMGGVDGDVFLDDITFREIRFEGLREGESIDGRTVKRLPFADGDISPQRMADQASFYLQHQEQTYESARLFIRDTLGSDVLLAPGRRVFDARDRRAARNYDFFCYDEFRSAVPAALDVADSPSWVHSANNMDGKPYVVAGLNHFFPRPHQAQMMTVLPAYAGLHDWDGIQFAHFAGVPVAGSERSNNNTFWDLYDKPHILTLMPAISNMMRRGDVQVSERTLQIANDTSSIAYPLFHTTGAFSLSAPVDTRMGIFRRLTMVDETQEEESFLPHLEISALAGDVDPTAYDAETGQILYDQTLGIMRVITPRTMSVTGRLANQIVTERDLIVEQVSAGDYTAVVLSSLTDSAVMASPSNILIVASRGVNEGAVFNQNNTALTDWGDGPMLLEGRTMRVTIRAPKWDSCHVTPLGADARPMTDKRRAIERSPTGRFSIAVETNVDESPWYLVEFSNIPTSVDEEGRAPYLSVAPNPVTDGSFTVRHIEVATQVELVDMTGAVVRTQAATGKATRIETFGLASGVYTVVIDGGRRGTSTVVIH